MSALVNMTDAADKDIGTAAAVVFRATFAQEIRNKRYAPDAEERLAQYLATFIYMIRRTCKTIVTSVYNDANRPILEGIVLAAVESLTHERLVEDKGWFPVTSADPVPPHIGDENENADRDKTVRFDTYWGSARGPFVRLFGPDMDAAKAAYNNVMTHAWLFRDALNERTIGDQVPIGRLRISQIVAVPIDIMATYLPINGLSTAIKAEIQRKIAKERRVNANPIDNVFGFVSNSNNNI
jgi:hypothetical protein